MLKLDSVNAKLDRAEEHARLLDREIETWMQKTPYAIAQKSNADFTRHAIIFSVLEAPKLTRWSLLLGDAVHNMRSALDHLVYAISVHELDANPPPNQEISAFLINDSPDDFKSKRWRIKDLSTGVQQAIEDVQPYKRTHAPMPPLLAVLRDFDDFDKHRLLKVVLERPVRFNWTVSAPLSELTGHVMESPYVDLVDGAEVAWVTTPRPSPHMQLNGGVTASIAVEHTPGPGPDGIERTSVERLLLSDLIPEVREVIRIVSGAVA